MGKSRDFLVSWLQIDEPFGDLIEDGSLANNLQDFNFLCVKIIKIHTMASIFLSDNPLCKEFLDVHMYLFSEYNIYVCILVSYKGFLCTSLQYCR
jgi:hypothetical protein